MTLAHQLKGNLAQQGDPINGARKRLDAYQHFWAMRAPQKECTRVQAEGRGLWAESELINSQPSTNS